MGMEDKVVAKKLQLESLWYTDRLGFIGLASHYDQEVLAAGLDSVDLTMGDGRRLIAVRDLIDARFKGGDLFSPDRFAERRGRFEDGVAFGHEGVEGWSGGVLE